MRTGSLRLSALLRYPLKGFSPERIPRVQLDAGRYFPGDRMFAVENGPSGFDVQAPEHQPKIKFLMLMRNAGLARLQTRYDDATGMLSIRHEGREVARGDLGTADGRRDIEMFLTTYAEKELRGRARVLAAPDGFRFTDSRSGFVSLINLASVADLERHVGQPVDPLRFRANLHVEGLEPWEEFDWPEGTILSGPGGVRLSVTKRIDRCAATNVDPVTGFRDLSIPQTLMRAYGHMDFGVYLSIAEGGRLAEGERLNVQGARIPQAEGLGLR